MERIRDIRTSEQRLYDKVKTIYVLAVDFCFAFLQSLPDRCRFTDESQHCRAATAFNKVNGGKLWEYAIIPHDTIHGNSNFGHLVDNRELVEEKLF